MTEPTAALMAMVVAQNKFLRKLDLSSNRLGPVSKNFLNVKLKIKFQKNKNLKGRWKTNSRSNARKQKFNRNRLKTYRLWPRVRIYN